MDIIGSFKNTKITNTNNDIQKDIYNDNLINCFAWRSLLGNTITISQCNAPIGPTSLTTDTNTPIIPNASGPYNLVIIGVNIILTICASKVPVTIIITLFINGLLIMFVIFCFIFSPRNQLF